VLVFTGNQQCSPAQRRRERPKTHLKHEQSTTANPITQPTSANPTQTRRKLLHQYLSLCRPRRIREPPTHERLVKHARAPIQRRPRASLERPNRDEQLLDGLPLRRKGRRFDLNAEHAPGRVGEKVSRGRAAAGADVWEEAQRADVLEDVRDGEGVVADDHRRWYLLLSRLRARAEPVDVQHDLARALSEDRRDHKVAIVEERKYGIEPAPHSDRLRDQSVRNKLGGFSQIELGGGLVPCSQEGCPSSSSKLTDGRPTCRLSR